MFIGNGGLFPGLHGLANQIANMGIREDVRTLQCLAFCKLQTERPARGGIDTGHFELGIENHQTVLNAGKNCRTFVLFRDDLFDVHLVITAELCGHLVELTGQMAQLIPGLHRHLNGIVTRCNFPGCLHKVPDRPNDPFGKNQTENQSQNQCRGRHQNGGPNRAFGDTASPNTGLIHGFFVEITQPDTCLSYLGKEGVHRFLVIG